MDTLGITREVLKAVVKPVLLQMEKVSFTIISKNQKTGTLAFAGSKDKFALIWYIPSCLAVKVFILYSLFKSKSTFE
ncbi:hypothetical protein COF68_15615 [Bacillus toyonensis]|nr:hypothetical protein COF68_15615 [Bacillus toyonensis]